MGAFIKGDRDGTRHKLANRIRDFGNGILHGNWLVHWSLPLRKGAQVMARKPDYDSEVDSPTTVPGKTKPLPVVEPANVPNVIKNEKSAELTLEGGTVVTDSDFGVALTVAVLGNDVVFLLKTGSVPAFKFALTKATAQKLAGILASA